MYLDVAAGARYECRSVDPRTKRLLPSSLPTDIERPNLDVFKSEDSDFVGDAGFSAHALDARVIKGLSVRELVCWALSTPIQFGVGMQFHIAAISSVRARVLGMDFLISLGTNAAYALSIVSVMTAVSTLYEVRVRLCAHSRLPPVSAPA